MSVHKDITMRVAWIIRNQRHMIEKDQGEVAKAIGVAQSTYQRMETGKSRLYVDQFIAICLALDLVPAAVLKAVAE